MPRVVAEASEAWELASTAGNLTILADLRTGRGEDASWIRDLAATLTAA